MILDTLLFNNLFVIYNFTIYIIILQLFLFFLSFFLLYNTIFENERRYKSSNQKSPNRYRKCIFSHYILKNIIKNYILLYFYTKFNSNFTFSKAVFAITKPNSPLPTIAQPIIQPSPLCANNPVKSLPKTAGTVYLFSN